MTKLLTCNCGSCEFWGPRKPEEGSFRVCLGPVDGPSFSAESHLCERWQPSFASRMLAEILYRKHLAKHLLDLAAEDRVVGLDDPVAVEEWIAEAVQKMLKALKKPLNLKDFPAGGTGSIYIGEAR